MVRPSWFVPLRPCLSRQGLASAGGLKMPVEDSGKEQVGPTVLRVEMMERSVSHSSCP